MARPTKQGLDYFPLDVVLDDKFKFIEIKFGIEGFGIVIKILQKIYSEGYWYKWGEDEALLFAGESRIDIDKINQIVDECLKRGIFNKELHEKYSILTSRGIQKRYYEVAKRRKNVEIVTDYTLYVDLMNINVDNNPSNVDINEALCKHDDNKSTQRKGKETRGEETKAEKEDGMTAAEEKASILKYFADNFGKVSKGVEEEIDRTLHNFQHDEILEAMKESEKQGVYKLSYVMAILKRQKENPNGKVKAFDKSKGGGIPGVKVDYEKKARIMKLREENQ